jgi:membrane-associated protein
VITLALGLAAICGDSTNYWIGRFAGPKVFRREKSLLLNKEYLDRTHQFYERHGNKTIIIARFVPIVRTFAPFVAGIGRMPYRRFILYSITGTVLWVPTFVLGGYFFGNIPIVRNNFTIVVMAIIFISILPGIIGFVNERINKKKSKAGKAI